MGLRGLGVSHPQVNVFCHDHATDHGLDRWNPHEAAIRLLALKTDHLQFLPFEHQAVALQHIRHDGFSRYVGAHFRPPERQFAVDGVLDVINGRPGSEHLGVGECSGQGVEAEVIVRVAVTDVDGGQLLAAGADFFHHLFGLGLAELGVHQNGLFLTADQYRCHRKNGLFAGVVDIQGQCRRSGVSGETESGGRQQNAFESGETDHLLLRIQWLWWSLAGASKLAPTGNRA